MRILSSVLGLLLVACATSTANGQLAEQGLSMQSRVKFDRATIFLVLTIRNDSKHDSWINGKFSWETTSCRAPSWEITLKLLDSRSRTLGSNCMFSRSPIRDGDYRRLKPGEEYSGEIQLDFCFSFEAGEKIKVRATYRDENESPPKPPPGATHWKGQISAMPVEFLVPVDFKP